MNLYNFISLTGMVGLVFLAWVFSSNRRQVNWHVVVWGISLQFLIGWFLLVFPPGSRMLLWANRAVTAVLDSALAGAQFLFGPLALPPVVEAGGQASLGFILAFQAFPVSFSSPRWFPCCIISILSL